MGHITRRELLKASAIVGLGSLSGALAACTAAATPQVVEKEVTRIVEGTPQLITETVIVKETVEVEKQVVTTTEPVALTWFIMRTVMELPTWTAMADLFEERNPGITIKVMNEPSGGQDKLYTMIAAGTPPDVLRWEAPQIIDLAHGDALIDLQPYVDRGDIVDIDDFVPQSIAAFQYKGGQYAIPMVFSCLAMHLNLKLFSDKGIDLPAADWAWEDYVTVSQALTELDSSGNIAVWGTGFDRSIEPRVIAFIWQNGGEVYNEDFTQCVLDSAESIEALQFLVDLIYKDRVAPTPVEESTFGMGPSELFMTGRLGMRVTGPWERGKFNETAGLEWDIAVLPAGKAGAATPLFCGGFGIPTGSKHYEESWRYITFLTSPEGQNIWASYGASSPARRSCALSDAFLSGKPDNARVYIDFGDAVGRPEPIFPGRTQTAQAIAAALDPMWLNTLDVPTAAKEAAAKANEVLATLSA